MIVRTVPFLFKCGVLVLVLAAPQLLWLQAVGLCLFLTWAYQYLIAAVYGVHKMPAMDAACFLGKDTARINFISVTTVEKYDYALARARAKKFLEEKPKLRYHITEIFGDYYWQDTDDIEGAVDKCMVKIPKEIQNERELEEFINEEINKPIPLN